MWRKHARTHRGSTNNEKPPLFTTDITDSNVTTWHVIPFFWNIGRNGVVFMATEHHSLELLRLRIQTSNIYLYVRCVSGWCGGFFCGDCGNENATSAAFVPSFDNDTVTRGVIFVHSFVHFSHREAWRSCTLICCADNSVGLLRMMTIARWHRA